jgi:hypothetical protein
LVKVNPEDLKKVFVCYYWADSEENRTVKVKFTHNGHACELTAILHVKKPVCTLSAEQNGVATITHGALGDYIAFISTPQGPGVSFSGDVQNPDGLSNGLWHFVQIIKKTSTIFNDKGKCQKIETNDVVLDSQYPYEPQSLVDSWTTGSGIHNARDSPGKPLTGSNQVNANDQFSMYIMFKPEGPQSKWVPLKCIDWGWSFCAKLVENSWNIYSPEKFLNPACETVIHPQWGENIKNILLQDSPCVPPCTQ